jgi:hypothetical protein
MTSRSLMSTGWLGLGLSLGLVALLGGACTTVVVENGSGGGGGTGGGCPDTAHCVTCPTGEPSEGEACFAVGTVCTYNEVSDCAKSDAIATCTATGWTLTFDYEGCCDDPCACGSFCGEVCPPLLPAQGDACDPSINTISCPFDVTTACGAVTATVTCNAGAWDVSTPPCVGTGQCTIYTASGDCLADASCRWLTPGCGAPAAPEGCYPAADCAEGSLCASGQTCTKVITNPCWNSNCTACGADAFVCTGPG